MSPTTSLPLPSGLMARFAALIGAIVWGLGDSLERQRRFGWGEPWLAPMAEVLRGYLGRTLARLTALHAAFLAGALPAASRRRAAPRPAVAGATVGRVRAPRRPPAIPPGPVFIEYGMRPYDLELGRLLDDPAMRDFLAAVPQAGRLLRPLWRRLTTEPLPDILRPPPPPCPVTLPDGATAWELRPSYLISGSPPQPARAAEPPAPEPAPAPPAHDAPKPPEPARQPRDYLRIGRPFIR
ncbi:MAG: hypothetical protein J0H14_01190 [Alphaproteobacteria bacterium]|nr:hypothetical protein [Alphaproteobacteria bacterium]